LIAFLTVFLDYLIHFAPYHTLVPLCCLFQFSIR
jgi:hypothetical protein